MLYGRSEPAWGEIGTVVVAVWLIAGAILAALLPGLVAARGAAFSGGLLAMLSVEAVRHAQDAREYSIDALLTVPIRQPRGRF